MPSALLAPATASPDGAAGYNMALFAQRSSAWSGIARHEASRYGLTQYRAGCSRSNWRCITRSCARCSGVGPSAWFDNPMLNAAGRSGEAAGAFLRNRPYSAGSAPVTSAPRCR